MQEHEQSKKHDNRGRISAPEKMDRQQFESFCKNLYMTAYEEGRKSVPGIDITEVQKAISDTPGIGSKRLQAIMDSLNSKFREESKDEQEVRR